MIKLAQLCLGIIGIPFLIVGISYVMKNTHTLPVDTEQACVYQIVQSGSNAWSRKGVGSYWNSGLRVTAHHVVQDCAGDCYVNMDDRNNKSKKLMSLQAIRRVGTSDVALFQISGNYICVTADAETSVLTIVSGALVRFPVVVSGNTIDMEMSYGQSGSPVYQDDELIGVVGQRAQGYSLIERVP